MPKSTHHVKHYFQLFYTKCKLSLLHKVQLQRALELWMLKSNFVLLSIQVLSGALSKKSTIHILDGVLSGKRLRCTLKKGEYLIL